MTKKTKIEFSNKYYDNEADANKHMSYVNAAAGVLAIVIWIMYIAKVFTIPDHFFPVVCVLFPVAAALMFVPIFFVKTDVIRKRGFKYLILFSLLAVIIALNISIPKHSLLFWPFAILMANHYYNPTIGRVIYIVSLLAMLFCLYAGMFFGEFDENLFGGGVIKPDGTIGTVETFEERLALLSERSAQGDNRYLKVLLFYYFPRAACLSLFFMVSNLLNRRTYKLLDDEVRIHDEQQKSKTELNVAKDIQMQTLPDDFVSNKDVEIVGELKAAKEVGGDLYDYVSIDDNHVALLVGDVSGKGVPAAMFMMKTITSFRDFATKDKTPSQILREINTSVMKGNKAGMFVTCFLAIIDKRDGKMIYANAGHNPPVIGSNRDFYYLKAFHGIALGCFNKVNIKDEEIVLKPGDTITLYTDGITEARDSDGKFFGSEKLLEVFNKKDYTSIVDIHHSIKDEVAEFVKDAPQSDDITFVTLKYRGGSYVASENEFYGNKENIGDMLDFINKFATENQFPISFTNKLLVVGDELFSNIIKHGYGEEGGPIFVRLLFNEDTKEFCIIVIDQAKEFNQLEVDLVDDDKPRVRVGGLGISIVKKIMTDCSYDHINGKNILVLKKKF